MVNSIEKIYCIIYKITKYGIEKKEKKGRKSKLTITEIITILVEGHRRGLTMEKQIYQLAKGELRNCFKEIPYHYPWQNGL